MRMGATFIPSVIGRGRATPLMTSLDKSLPQDVQGSDMFGQVYRVPARHIGHRWKNTELSGKRKTAVAQSKLEDEKPKDGKPEEEKPRKDSSLVFLAQMLLCAVEKF